MIRTTTSRRRRPGTRHCRGWTPTCLRASSRGGPNSSRPVPCVIPRHTRRRSARRSRPLLAHSSVTGSGTLHRLRPAKSGVFQDLGTRRVSRVQWEGKELFRSSVQVSSHLRGLWGQSCGEGLLTQALSSGAG